MRRASLPALALALLATSGPARAEGAGLAEFLRLVRRAPHDASVLDRLRRIEAVEGVRVDLRPVVDGATEVELNRRLAELVPAIDDRARPSDARAEAAEILGARRFRDTRPPKPLKGFLEWLGERTRGIESRLSELADVLPGGLLLLWLLVALLLAGISAIMALRAGRVRGRSERVFAPGADGDETIELLRAAECAESSGDLETALRLRFKAGIVRLGRRGALPLRPSLTSEDIAHRLRSPTFDDLAATFDRVVYGRRGARERDVAEARSGWRTIEAELER